MADQLDVEGTRSMLLAVADKVIAGKDQLTAADRAIGDGDHGIGMARGFEATRQALERSPATTIAEPFKAVGMAIMSKTGGAAGAVFGTWFRAAGQGAGDAETLDAALFARMLRQGLEAVQKRGGAKPGDKTMVDVLVPATEAAEANVALGLADMLDRVVEAARAGVEHTREMVATVGKAKTLGDRALGHPDPGSVSTCMIFEACRDFARKD